MRQHAPPVILCIGSPRVSGDRFGPITGQLLKEVFSCPAYVYGTMSDPVHAMNLVKRLEQIRLAHPLRKIIVIDAAVGGKTGDIRAFPGPLRPGLATGKHLCPVGDFSITACVCGPGGNALISVSPDSVFLLALRAASLIRSAFGNGKCRVSEKRVFLL